jgi:hypothetical protein
MPFNTSLAEKQSNVSRSAGDISCTSGLRYQTPTLRSLLPIPHHVNLDFARIKNPTTQHAETGFSSNEDDEDTYGLSAPIALSSYSMKSGALMPHKVRLFWIGFQHKLL